MSTIAMQSQSSSSSIPATEESKPAIHMSRRGYPKLVIPCGRARSGKDTCAEYLQAVWGYKINHFAGALKRGCKEFFKHTDDQLYGASKMTEDPYWKTTPRLNFQLVGTELMRNQFPKLVMNEMRRLRFKTDLSVAERATIASFQENAINHMKKYLLDVFEVQFYHLQPEELEKKTEKNISKFANDMFQECLRYLREEFPLRAMSIMRPDLEPVDNIGENFWIKRITKDYIDLTEDESMCIADGRFPNETKFGKDNGGICFRITRPGTVKMEHDSERFIDDLEVDFEIANTGTIEDMLRKLTTLLGLDGKEHVGISPEEYYANLKLAINTTSQISTVTASSSNNNAANVPSTARMVLFVGDREIAEACANDVHTFIVYTLIESGLSDGSLTSDSKMLEAFNKDPNREYVGYASNLNTFTPNNLITVIEIKASGTRSKWNANECIIANTSMGARQTAVTLVYDLLKNQGLLNNESTASKAENNSDSD